MAIPSQQIGWSQRAKLLWNISKQLENLIKVAGNVNLPTTTTTTTATPISLQTSTESPCGPGATVPVTFVVGTSLCNLDPLPQLSGDFAALASEFYGTYGGQSRFFVKLNNSLIQAAGGAPGECVTCG